MRAALPPRPFCRVNVLSVTFRPSLARLTPGDGAVETLQVLLDRLDIPRRLRDIGLAQADLEHVADAAMSDWFISRAPRRISSPHELRGILESAW